MNGKESTHDKLAMVAMEGDIVPPTAESNITSSCRFSSWNTVSGIEPPMKLLYDSCKSLQEIIRANRDQNRSRGTYVICVRFPREAGNVPVRLLL